MRLRSTAMLLAALAGCATAALGCTADIHDNTLNVSLDDATVSFDTDVDVDHVKQGQNMPCKVDAKGVNLIEPSQTPPPDKADLAGHFQFYLDDTDSEPLLITAQTSVQLTIPASTPEGDHKVICRLHHHDGKPTSVTFEVDIKVEVKTTG